MSARRILVCGILVLLLANVANAARYQRATDGKTLVWNNLRGVAEQVTWSGARDSDGYATGKGTLTWYRLGSVVNSYTGKMVHGKFEGPVIKEQGQTRLQATFVNGEKAGGWSEPRSTPIATATIKESPGKPAETQATEKSEIERPSPTPTPSPLQTILPTPLPSQIPASTPSRSPTPTPTPSATPTPSPSPTPKPSPTPRPTATLTPTATPIPVPSVSPSPTLQPSAPPPGKEWSGKASRLEEVVEGPIQDSLTLASPSPSLRNALEEAPLPETSASSPTPTAAPRGGDSKDRLIAEFKQQTKSVLAEVSDATANFRRIDRLNAVIILPPAVTADIASVANRARDFRAKLGYEIAFHECRIETETVDALTVVDSVHRDFAGENALSGQTTLSRFLDRYPEPPSDNQKPLWQYLTSALSLCNRLKEEAAIHWQRAKSLVADGKTSEALREYEEIYRIFPNPTTAEKIRQLQGKTR